MSSPHREHGPISTILLIIITILLPPVGVYIVSGCGADLLINICLTLLGALPGHIHAFYIEMLYFRRHERSLEGEPVAGTYRDNPQRGETTYGTV